jgi:hypothetical protein
MSIKKTIEIEARFDKAEKDLEGVANSVQKIDKNLEEVKNTSSGVAKGVKGIGNALKAAGIGLAIAAFAKLGEVFNQNQKVANAFNIAFEGLSLAFNDFFKFLDSNVGTVIDYFKGIFSDPKQAMIDFGNGIKANLTERFNSFLETLGYLSSAVKKVFSNDFAGALEDVKNAGKESLDVLTGVDNAFDKSVETVTNATKAIVDYTKSTIDSAASIVDLNRKSNVGIAQNRIILEQKDREAEKLRQIRDDETKTIDERIAANNKLAEVLNEQERLMLANADAVIAAAQAQFDKNGNDENQIALLEAQAEKAGILAQVEGFRSEQIINRISLEKEERDLELEKREEEKEFQESEKDRKAKEAEDKEKAHQEELRQKEEIRQSTLRNLDTLIGAAGKETAIGKALFIAKQAMLVKEQIAEAKATLAKITMKASESSVALAQGTAETAKVGFPQNIPLLIAFAAQAVGIFSSIKSAVGAAKSSASKYGGSGGGASTSFRAAAAPSAPQAPAFNVVGASGTNQLAEAINGRDAQPVKAFVVSNEVTNAQALDRNIVNSASLG